MNNILLSEQEVFENNNLLAEFSGFEKYQDKEWTPLHWWKSHNHKLNLSYQLNSFVSVDYLNFSRSWDWLMATIELIENNGMKVIIEGNKCTICDESKRYHDIVDDNNKFNSVYKAAVNYVKRNMF